MKGIHRWPVISPQKRASNVERTSIGWHHHAAWYDSCNLDPSSQHDVYWWPGAYLATGHMQPSWTGMTPIITTHISVGRCPGANYAHAIKNHHADLNTCMTGILSYHAALQLNATANSSQNRFHVNLLTHAGLLTFFDVDFANIGLGNGLVPNRRSNRELDPYEQASVKLEWN